MGVCGGEDGSMLGAILKFGAIGPMIRLFFFFFSSSFFSWAWLVKDSALDLT